MKSLSCIYILNVGLRNIYFVFGKTSRGSRFYDVDRNLMLAHMGSRRLSTTSCEIQDAVTIVQDIKDAEAASRKLIQEAYARGSSDNITCVVVRFEKNTRE